MTRRELPRPSSQAGKKICEHLWEVEACRDGRLSSEARAKHLDHVRQCADCSSESQAIERLRRELVGLAPDPDDIALRRLRQATLQQADAMLAGRSARPRRSRVGLVVFAVCALVSAASLASLGRWVRRSRSPVLATSSQSPAASATPDVSPRPPVVEPAPATSVTPTSQPSSMRAREDLSPRARPLRAPPEGSEEDASYLHIVALLREGRPAEARLAARDYLRRFPAGFRRPEVERIAR